MRRVGQRSHTPSVAPRTMVSPVTAVPSDTAPTLCGRMIIEATEVSLGQHARVGQGCAPSSRYDSLRRRPRWSYAVHVQCDRCSASASTNGFLLDVLGCTSTN